MENPENNLVVTATCVGDLNAAIEGYYHYDRVSNKHYVCDRLTLVRKEVRSETLIASQFNQEEKPDADYEVRENNGEMCIMSKHFNVRIATFSKGTAVDAIRIGKILQQEEKPDGWVDVKERLPDEDDTYLIYPIHDYRTAHFNKYGEFKGKFTRADHNGYDFEVYVTHYQPLPSPPIQKGESK